MTKVTILGQAESAEPEKKKIEFVHRLEPSGNQSLALVPPAMWSNIVLLAANWQERGEDLMFAFDDTESILGVLYLGHFNDGVV